MPRKPVWVCGNRYSINPSLGNMCNLERESGVNLIQGVDPAAVDLNFMRLTIENLVEDEDGKHISPAVLNTLYTDDVETAQNIFLQIFREMYRFPKIPKRVSATTPNPKNPNPRQHSPKPRRGGS